MTKTKIEWATDVWNPTVGCTKVSSGCKNCYAERIFNRFHRWPVYPPYEKFSQVKCYPERLDQPLHWRRSRRVFVDSMSDLFHTDVPIEFIEKIFAICRIAEEHTFIILTKRPERMFELLNSFSFWVLVSSWVAVYAENGPKVSSIPDNIWLGVSVEDQKTADERIPLLLQTPAALRFVSVEPMLGKIDIWQYLGSERNPIGERFNNKGLDWVICGCESGSGARPMKMSWAADLKHQCVFGGVPFFFKQAMIKGKLVKMPELDGKIWDELPKSA
jgi:protein gp37